MRKGKLYYAGNIGRYDVRFTDGYEYGGIHAGDVLEVSMDGVWEPLRIEYNHSGGGYWYFVGADTTPNEVCLYGYAVRL